MCWKIIPTGMIARIVKLGRGKNTSKGSPARPPPRSVGGQTKGMRHEARLNPKLKVAEDQTPDGRMKWTWFRRGGSHAEIARPSGRGGEKENDDHDERKKRALLRQPGMYAKREYLQATFSGFKMGLGIDPRDPNRGNTSRLSVADISSTHRFQIKCEFTF